MLDDPGPLNEFDYEFLKGNTEFWPRRGSAFNVCGEWCLNRGYGDFGKPTPSGIIAMNKYENSFRGICKSCGSQYASEDSAYCDDC